VWSSHEFLFRQWQRVKEGLHWGLAEAPAALMWAPLIVLEEPVVPVSLQLLDGVVDLLAETVPGAAGGAVTEWKALPEDRVFNLTSGSIP
jgi:hypothetical protein